MLSRTDLHEYQKTGVEFILSKKRCALFLDMGMGKTATSLTAILDLIQSAAVSKVLVVAPLRVANSVWKQETEKWKHLNNLRVNVCTGCERKRIASLLNPADVYTINRENIPWLVEHYGKKWPFDCVVIDESSSFKNQTSQRFKALRRILPYTEYLWLLTGTPSPNSLLELWPQMYLVDNGERLGKTITSFRQRFFDQDFMGYTYTIRTGSEDKIHDLIKDKVMSMQASDYLSLPERIDIIENVALPTKAKQAYYEFEKKLIAEIEGEELEASSAAVLANRLLQFSNGAVYTDESKNFVEIHSEKLNALAELIEQNPNENILLAYNYKSDLSRIKSRFPSAIELDKQQSTIDDWNNGKIKLLLAHPASAGHGLNLQNGGSTIVWFGLTWSLELYQQFNGRLHRQGQTKPVRVVHIVAENCIDERVLKVIEQKDATQSALLNAVKCLIIDSKVI